ncbi:MAG: fimbrial biogenesis outer membrane usher protein, partial [Proteobacteria bacterium]|nr:fimbrial biogenesis outer membrane usher protein [Pseudomonadota bacterium]
MSNRSTQPRRWAVDRFRLIVAVGALWLGIVAHAKAAELQRLQLEVLINGAPTNLIGSFVRDWDGRIGATPAELETIGIRVGRNERQSQVIFLDNLPGIRYHYDMPAQRLLVTATDNRRIPKVYDLRPEQHTKVAPRSDYGAVLNYNVFAASANSTGLPRFDFQGASTTLDARVFTPFGIASQSGILRSAPDNDSAFLRLDSRFTYSDPSRMMTYVAGDAITNGFAWTRPIRIGGLQVARNFALRPDLVTMPLPSASGSAAVPSTLDVYVNNIKTFSQDVQAGPYNITNIPAVTGAGDAKVVVRDASGRETQTSLPFFTSSWLLKPSLTDFSVEVGAPRQFYGTGDDSYVASPVISASLRRGITDSLTLESHGEGGLGLVNGGFGVAFRTGSFGVADVALSASRFDDHTGLQVYGAYSAQAYGLNLNVSSLRRFGDYSDLASVTSALRPGIDLNIAGTAPFYKLFTSF